MNGLKIFNFENQEVRMQVIDDEPWFVAKDVCEILDIKNVSDAVNKLKQGFKTTVALTDSGSNYKTNALAINEAGMYKLIFKSRKQEAERFSDWIAGDVLPSIRKHGGYLTPEKIEEALLNPDTLIQLATNLKEERSKRLAAEQKVTAMTPKALFADAVAASHTSILIGELSKLINQNGVNIGQNRLFEWLRGNGYLIKRKGTDFNMPTQYSMELGLFEIKERTINNADGSIRTTKTPKVTGKGQQYFINKFLKNDDSIRLEV